jgi:DNA-binding response OmpR family regulator
MKTYLRADGFVVDHTSDPAEALKFASRVKYELVITDLIMRGMTGIDLYREIKSSYDSRTAFMFLLTVSAEGLRLLGSLDRKDVIKKEPLSINEVIFKVHAAIMSNH